MEGVHRRRRSQISLSRAPTRTSCLQRTRKRWPRTKRRPQEDCGAGWAIHPSAATALPSMRVQPSRRHRNCSRSERVLVVTHTKDRGFDALDSWTRPDEGYGDATWLREMIMSPGSPQRHTARATRCPRSATWKATASGTTGKSFDNAHLRELLTKSSRLRVMQRHVARSSIVRTFRFPRAHDGYRS